MTENHDYHTPEEGTANWHIPLNENFERIDAHVEVRNTEANLDQYRPLADAKFLATDTGNIYLGDGQRWQQFGSVASTFRVGKPGGLQATLDRYGAGPEGPGVVACEPGEVYETAPYSIPENTTLLCNGATFRATSDADLLVPEAGSRIVGPAWFDSESPSYSSSHINIDAGQTRSSPLSMRGGREIALFGLFRHVGTTGEGNAIRMRGATNDGSGADHNVTQNYLGHHYVRRIGDVLLADADGGFLNDNHIWLEASNCTNFWHHTGTKQAKFLIYGHLQTGNMDRGFYNETDRASCRFWGHLEDPHRTRVANVEGPKMKIYPTTRANFSQQPWDLGPGSTVGGIGYERANREQPPNDALYFPGEMVVFEDTGDGSGSGLYVKNPWAGVTPWIRIASGSFM